MGFYHILYGFGLTPVNINRMRVPLLFAAFFQKTLILMYSYFPVPAMQTFVPLQ